MSDTGQIFTDLGGRFLTPADDIREKYSKIKVLVFDWDGVFNDGNKFSGGGSVFSEADSMGVNLLRFNYFLIHNELAHAYIVTGLSNELAISFAKRENFDGIFLNFKFKEEAFDKICAGLGCGYDQIAFVFDDVLDLGMAKKCNLSFFVRRKSSPLTSEYVLKNKICDYVTGAEGGQHAVREICELLMGLSGKFNETVEKRILFRGIYEDFFTHRKKVTTRVFTND